MMRIHGVLSLGMLVLTCGPLAAQDYCPPDADGGPHGMVREYEGTTLLFCDDTDWPVVSVEFNREAMPEIENERALLALSVTLAASKLVENPLSGGNFVSSAETELGGVAYTRWSTATKGQTTYITSGDGTTPAHFVTCFGEDPSGGGTCFLRVPYRNINARLMLIGEFEAQECMPREDFPSLARSMFTILSYMERSSK